MDVIGVRERLDDFGGRTSVVIESRDGNFFEVEDVIPVTLGNGEAGVAIVIGSKWDY